MLETIITFLLSLALGTAGAAGLAVAAEASADARSGAAPISLDEELAAIRAHVEEARANADENGEAEITVEPGSEHGLTTAATAIEAAMETAPPAADTGLTIALEAVLNAPIGGAPEGTPGGAPEGTPGGPPEGTPSGQP